MNAIQRAEWDFRGAQIPSDSSATVLLNRLATSGIVITQGVDNSETTITITQAGREVYSNDELKIACTGLTESGRLDIEISCDYYVRTYGECICVCVCLCVCVCVCAHRNCVHVCYYGNLKHVFSTVKCSLI